MADFKIWYTYVPLTSRGASYSYSLNPPFSPSKGNIKVVAPLYKTIRPSRALWSNLEKTKGIDLKH